VSLIAWLLFFVDSLAMMSRRNSFRSIFVFAFLASALFVPAGIVVAQPPANPSFSGTMDQDALPYVFPGTYRVGGPGATFNFSVFNIAPLGSSRMSLDSVVTIPDPMEDPVQNFQLQTGAATNIAPGGQAPMQIVLSTLEPSPPHAQSSVFYSLRFKSIDSPGQPIADIAIAAYATVLRRGDYDGDGDVDNIDYGIWRSTLGNTGSNLAADGNQNNVVDAADYAIWRNDYTGPLFAGDGVVNGALNSMAIVPEPASLTIIVLAATLVGMSGARRRRRHMPRRVAGKSK
jgi:hypothetical protein